jgi:tetratricopeptide (TPR) repeat protein
VVVQEKPKLQHVQQFHGGAVRLLGVAAIVVAGVAGYWFAIGRPELPSPHALTQLLPAGQSQNQVQNQATSAPPDENAAADLPPPLESAPAAPLPDAQHSAFDAAPAGRLHTAAGTAVKPSDLTRLLPQCANTSDANERILCAQVAFALDDGWFADDNEQPKLPYWMTLSYRVAIATFLAREDASSENAASSSLASQHIEAGKALASAQELEGAVREFTEAIRIDPQSATAHVERGQVLFKHGNTESAVADFETAIKLDPQSAAAYKALGMAVHYLGNSDRAITNLSRAIEIAEADPSRLPVIDVFFSRRIRAALFNGKGRSDEELADLNWIINEYWTNAALRTALRENYGEDGVSGVIVHIYRARAVNLIARRNYDGATADISMAMQLDPRQTLALTILRARVLEMAGHREQAAADYKRALELSPTNDDVKSALARLRKGGAQPSGTRPSTPAIPVD